MLARLNISEGGGSLAPRVYFCDDTGGATRKVHVGFVGPHHLVRTSRRTESSPAENGGAFSGKENQPAPDGNGLIMMVRVYVTAGSCQRGGRRIRIVAPRGRSTRCTGSAG